MAENMSPVLLSSLEKVFPETKLEDLTPFEKFSMLRNEKSSFQIGYTAKKGEEIHIQIDSILKDKMTVYSVQLIPSKSPAPKISDDYYLKKTPGLYPDLLMPLENNTCKAVCDGSNAIWFEINSKDILPVGDFNISITITQNGIATTKELTVSVIDALLPKQSLIFTNWFHTDCLMSYYHIDAFSKEYWRIVENYLRRANEYGMNAVLTPLFTPPLDTEVGGERPTVQLVDVKVLGKDNYEFKFTRLEQWIEMCNRCGIEYFEMSHFFTQWGAKHAPKIMADVDGNEKQIFGWKTRAAGKEYKKFIAAFAKALIAFIDAKGIRERCIFHVSDEPNGTMILSYMRASKIVHKNFKGFKIVDALSDYTLYRLGLIDTPIPANNHIKAFIGKVPELWTYYCCSQGNQYVSNRFFAMPSQRNRVLGYQLYKFDVKGFLHWGFNFYFSQFSKRQIDPYQETDAGGAFFSGDGFVVYPKEDGTPLNSLRLLVFYDGFQDMMALQLLESKIGREKTMSILEDGLSEKITFSNYPHSNAWQLETRERINAAIANA